MGNPFSSGSGSNNLLQGLSTLAPQGSGGASQGKSSNSMMQNQGLMDLFQQLVHPMAPGLYKAKNTQVPDLPSGMNVSDLNPVAPPSVPTQ